MTRALCAALLLLGCGGHRGPAARLPVRPVAPAAPAMLEVVPSNQEDVLECQRHDLAIRLRAGGRVVSEETLKGECVGACTEEAQAEGKARVEEIQKQIASGEATDSELDYNFTECQFMGAELARTDAVGARRVALIVGYDPGPHDVPNRWFRLAFDVCGHAFVGQPFGKTYADRWHPEDLVLAPRADVIVVTGKDTPAVELYRVSVGAACKPDEQVAELAE